VNNVTDALNLAVKENTLLEAQEFMCVWEMERIVKRVKSHPNEPWESCFGYCLSALNFAWEAKQK